MKKDLIVLIFVLSTLPSYSQQTTQNLPELIPYPIGDKWEYSDSQGEITWPCIYDTLTLFLRDYSHVKENGVWKFFDKKRNIILDSVEAIRTDRGLHFNWSEEKRDFKFFVAMPLY